ncbi:very short patch repair endonuclease [Capillimicrobium parvum]|uniref:very short patch repair endonuclease n=1 Tax=Capillimicrobium parvum TaxID=2884022 RepID=UPI0038990A25
MTGYPQPADEATSIRMRANRRRDTGPEVAVRSLLHRAGLRFFVDRPLRLADGLSVRPDISFPRSRTAVFIDGCFWHVCPEHGTRPRRNQEYWAPKLQRNVERDRRVDRALANAGWIVARYWEHQDPTTVARAITRLVTERSALANAERSV